MNRKKTIATFSLLGDCMIKWGRDDEVENFPTELPHHYHDKMLSILQNSKHHNGWFTEASIKQNLVALGSILTEGKLNNWLEQYPVVKEHKFIGLILAGNIPMVGFHDVLCTLLSGHKAVVKLSSDDKLLIPFLIDVACEFQPSLQQQIEWVDKLPKVTAVIATGSNNTARYFEKYFGHLPHIIRKNRTSIAVLKGNENVEDLRKLGDDIFSYFGLGCRNVSHLLFPIGYSINQFFKGIVNHGYLINHNKYGNNYDYYKAIYLMNKEQLIENGFVLTRETEELFAPVSVLHYHYYFNKEEVDKYIQANADKIQVVIGKDYTPFGEAQNPQLDDYADNINTMQFLQTIG